MKQTTGEEQLQKPNRDVLHHVDVEVKSKTVHATRASKCKRNNATLRKKTRRNLRHGRSFRQGLPNVTGGEDSTTETIIEDTITLSSDEEYENVQMASHCDMDVKRCTTEDIKRRNDNFMTPRRLLANAELPDVDRTIHYYSIECLTIQNLEPQDPLAVDRVPPWMHSVKSLTRKQENKGNNTSFSIRDMVLLHWKGCVSLADMTQCETVKETGTRRNKLD